MGEHEPQPGVMHPVDRAFYERDALLVQLAKYQAGEHA